MILTQLPSTLYSAATRLVETPNIAPDLSIAKVTLTRESWPVGDVLSATVDLSLDGGASWTPAGGFAAPGGDHVLKNLTIAPSSTFSMRLPDVGNALRRWRVSITNTVSLRTAITVEAI